MHVQHLITSAVCMEFTEQDKSCVGIESQNTKLIPGPHCHLSQLDKASKLPIEETLVQSLN